LLRTVYRPCSAHREAEVDWTQIVPWRRSITTVSGSSAYSNWLARSCDEAKNSWPVTKYVACVSSSSMLRETHAKCETRRTKAIIAANTTSPTPMSRLQLITVGMTVISMMTVSDTGMFLSVRGAMECHSKVE